MNGIPVKHDVKTADTERENDETEKQKQGSTKILCPDLTPNDSDQREKQENKVDQAGSLGNNDHIVARGEIESEEAIGHQEPLGELGRHGLGFVGILIYRAADESEREIDTEPVDLKADKQDRNIEDPALQNGQDRGIVIRLKKLLDQQQDQQTGCDRNIRLIDAGHQNNQQNGTDPVLPPVLRGLPDSEHTEQKSHRIAAACIHVAESTDLRRKTNDQRGQEHYAEPTAQTEQMDDNADGKRDQQKAHDPVQPWHGVIRDHKAQQLQTPASRTDGLTLAEQISDIVVVRKLVCDDKSVSQQTEDQRREEGEPALPQPGQKTIRETLCQRQIVRLHDRTSLSLD